MYLWFSPGFWSKLFVARHQPISRCLPPCNSASSVVRGDGRTTKVTLNDHRHKCPCHGMGSSCAEKGTVVFMFGGCVLRVPMCKVLHERTLGTYTFPLSQSQANYLLSKFRPAAGMRSSPLFCSLVHASFPSNTGILK